MHSRGGAAPSRLQRLSIARPSRSTLLSEYPSLPELLNEDGGGTLCAAAYTIGWTTVWHYLVLCIHIAFQDTEAENYVLTSVIPLSSTDRRGPLTGSRRTRRLTFFLVFLLRLSLTASPS